PHERSRAARGPLPLARDRLSRRRRSAVDPAADPPGGRPVSQLFHLPAGAESRRAGPIRTAPVDWAARAHAARDAGTVLALVPRPLPPGQGGGGGRVPVSDGARVP